jgi:hypothetical protein
VNWINLALDPERLRVVLSTVTNIWAPRRGEFLDSLSDYQRIKDLAAGNKNFVDRQWNNGRVENGFLLVCNAV